MTNQLTGEWEKEKFNSTSDSYIRNKIPDDFLDDNCKCICHSSKEYISHTYPCCKIKNL